MMKIYRTQDKQLTRVDDMNEEAWICLTNPTDDEVRRVAATLDIEPADIVAATDPEESARISLEDGYTVIIVDIPVKVDGAGEGIYTTIPLGHPADAGADRHGLLHRYRRYRGFCRLPGQGVLDPQENAVRLPAALPRGHDVPAGAAPDRPPPPGH